VNSLTRLANRVSAGPRMLRQMKRGQRFGQHLTCDLPPSGTDPEPGWLESYFDHHQTGPGIDKWRHYFPIYEQHLSKFRGQEVHLVEIGVFSGGSLGMWQSYLGPGAHIYGVDIAPECRSYAREGVEIFVGDQADPAFWRDFKDRVPRIDVVIDDGGHMAFQQIATLEALLPALQPGGIYLCEDIHFQFSEFSDYLFGLGQNLNTWGAKTAGQPGREASGFQRAIHGIHLYPYVAVIERRAESLERLRSTRRGSEWQSDQAFWQLTSQASNARY
jgi:hypothetical protein